MDRRMIEEVKKQVEPLPPGWTLHFETAKVSLPASLASLRLDAVATNGEEGIVYEVAVGRQGLQDAQKVDKLRKLRASTHSLPGWTFELIILPEPPPSLLESDEIEARTAEIRAILDSELSREPASPVLLDGLFLAGFAVLEASIAKLASQRSIDYRPLAMSLATSLTEEGILSQDQLTRLRAHQSRRNALAHGRRQAHSTRLEVNDLLALVVEVRASNAESDAMEPSPGDSQI